MNLSKKLALIKEINRRDLAAATPSFSFNNFAFDKQKEFFKSSGSRFRTAVCSRRAGKTVGIAGNMIDICLREPGVICLYLTITHSNVRSIIWRDLTKIVTDYKIPCNLNNLRMEINFPNGSTIATGGVKDASVIENYRGWKIRQVYLDECQSMRPHVRSLIKDVLIPALRDFRGELFLIGTPGPTKTGIFYEYSHNKKWHNLKWTGFDNPYMHNPEKGLDLNVTLAEERLLQGITEDDPSYQRENFGIWVEDLEALVIKYNETINDYNELPPAKLDYILGIDIGYEDSDAIAVLAYSYQTNHVYVVEEIEKNKQDITALAETIKSLKSKYNPVKMVMDAGALGKKIQEELRLRHALAIEAADKQRKLEYLEFLNADLRRGVIKAKKEGLFAQDSKMVTWDRSNPEKPIIAKSYHSDIMDAVLYAYRECRHYIKDIPKETVNKNTAQYMDMQEKEEAEKLERQLADPEMYEYEQSFEEDTEEVDSFYSDLDF